ncbi:ParB/RepB/Spo0J family partition protein [Altererythrobacter indicus]|uniref:ParB/RepB/Spo0J family partition protein n=1 Tax=Altericroceibacterium indicum TaxID=374177 RepID=A0A845ABH8_9SPHN|nr:ParB/RepB/Spo0J family partition protein [Altericroceibacterium indicum]MXP27044.1 ParB/RepB/Spo0J family partition protein [Altericroceibacterium indicum]
MAKKQKDYLASLLADEDEIEVKGSSGPEDNTPPAPPPAAPAYRGRGTTLLGRESALARVSSGEVRQVTQLLLDPAKVRVWEGNARSYEHLNEVNCAELIDSLVAEGGQKVPAIVRRVEDDPAYDYEVVAGTRRHWSISWLRQNSYPEMQFLATVQQLDDEAAFRVADIENRARKDVSDLERARNYAAALTTHYGNHLTRMAERLKLSKGWLSKMLKVANIPDAIIDAFASPADVQLKPAYPLAQALDDKDASRAIRSEAGRLAKLQATRKAAGDAPIAAPDVIRRLLAAGANPRSTPDKLTIDGNHGRPAVTVQSNNRQGVTLRLHAGHGLNKQDLLHRVETALDLLERDGKGLQR